MVFFFLLISLSYFIHSLKFISHFYDCNTQIQIHNQVTPLSVENLSISAFEETLNPKFLEETSISHIIFNIATSSNLWKKRKEYIKLWWKSKVKKGIIWFDKTDSSNKELLPPLKNFEDTLKFKYNNPKGHGSAVRISRIVSEILRLKIKYVRWFVMGDNDTLFVTKNWVKILQNYNHNQYYYIGSSLKSHLQNIYFSYNMACGSGKFTRSYPLVVALEKMQDGCLQRYPRLYGFNDRIEA